MSEFPAGSYDGALDRTADGGVIRFERHLPYPILDVWDAITNPAWLAEWWLPFDADFRRAWWPYNTVLGRVEGIPGYHDTRSYPHAERLAGLVIFRFDAPLFFANARTFREEIRRLADPNPKPQWIVVAPEPITDIDTTAADMLADLDEALNEQGISLAFAEMKDPVREKIERYELTRTIDPNHFFPTLDAAIEAFRRDTSVQREAPPEPTD